MDGKLQKKEIDSEIIEFVCKEILEIKKLQDQFSKIHTKNFESAQKAKELIINATTNYEDSV